MRLVLISDTHGHHDQVKLPEGDVLIHSGDFSTDGGRQGVRLFLQWMERQTFAHKILIAGNHDIAFEKWPDHARLMAAEEAPSVTYLQDSGCVLGGLRFWGSPVQPEFYDWAFNRKRGAEIKRHWDMIPFNVDVLITHGPAASILDLTADGRRDGCKDLYEALLRTKPLVHTCGHFHRSYGQTALNHPSGEVTQCFNASICDERYKPTRAPHVFDIAT